MILPAEARSLFDAFSSVFTQPTFHRFLVLLGSAILTTGRRTVANIRRTAAPMARGHRTTYQRVFSSAEWSALRLACQPSRLVLALIPADVAAPLVGDDTVDGHPGRKVYGKARHRDPARPGHGYTAWRSGHKWVVLAVLVRFPWANRPWALPVLVDLYRSKEDDQQRGRPYRTPARIMATLLRVMIRWFPRRRFVFVGDSGYGTHELARFAHRHRARLALVSELHPEADPFEPPPPYPGKGRPPVKGPRRPKPGVAGAAAELRAETVARYGGGTRQVGLTTGTGHRGRGRRGPGAAGVGVRAGSDRDASGRVFLQHRPGDDGGGHDRRLLRPPESGDHLPRGPLLPRAGEHRGLVPPDGVAGRPVPLRLGLGRGVAGSELAGVEADGPGGVARQAGRDVLRRHRLGTPLVVAGMGFSTGRRSHDDRSTARAIAGGLVLRPGTGGIVLSIPHQSSLARCCFRTCLSVNRLAR